MRVKTREIDIFDRAYRDRIRNIVWDAILEGSRDSATNVTALQNYEIYDALLNIQAMILASAEQACSPTEMRATSNEFAKRLRRLVAEFKKTYDRDGVPFDVIHTDELQ